MLPDKGTGEEEMATLGTVRRWFDPNLPHLFGCGVSESPGCDEPGFIFVTYQSIFMENKHLLIEARMADDNVFLGLCIHRLYERQELDEQTIGVTRHNNGVGFNKSDSEYLSNCAVSVKENGELYKQEIPKAIKLMKKYAKQLCTLIKDAEI